MQNQCTSKKIHEAAIKIRPLKKISKGNWISNNGCYLFKRVKNRYEMKVFWHVIYRFQAEPINWCAEHKTLKKAVAFVESLNSPDFPINFDCKLSCKDLLGDQKK